MKIVFLTLALMIGSSHAHAFMSKTVEAFAEITKASTNVSYLLDTYQIGEGSHYLPSGDNIQSADLQINSRAKTVTLTVYKKTICAPGRFCSRMVYAPVKITLPIVYVGSPFCGGKIVRAERNSLPVDGDFLSIELVDDNGNRCSGNADDMTFRKRAHITITEKASRENHEVVSEMSGLPEIN